ncbi:retrotransposon protein, putative, ty1-copia subclass, partial [Tanacetum coccineum]
KKVLSDVWALDTAQKPYVWLKLDTGGDKPSARMYATASARSDIWYVFALWWKRHLRRAFRLLIEDWLYIKPLDDAYALLMHKNGQWEWTFAPGVSPSSRYQHAAVFVGARLHVTGGALRGGRVVDGEAAVAVLRVKKKIYVIEQPISPAPAGDSEANVLAEWNASRGKGKANGKGKDKQVYIPKPKNPKSTAKEHPAKDDTYHHYNEGLRGARKLKQGALYLYMGNGVRAQVKAIGSFDLVLPNGLVICLDNCHYAPTITRGVVSVHHLVENGFVQRFTDYGISISKNDVLYFNVFQSNGMYEIDMHDLFQMPECIENAITRGLLKSLEWCLRVKWENQLGKTIKALQLDRGDEYISQEFKDYLKACGIVQQLTPPYTPQHNCVSERRNHTLLDMVRSVMNLTTLPLSFWDYVWGCEALVKRDTPEKLQQRSVKCIFIGYLKETMGYYFYFPPANKIIVARYAEFFEKSLITQEVSRRAIDLEEIQDEDTSPSEITSKIPMEVEGFEPPQQEVILIRRSERTHRALNRLCLNVEVDEHSLGDLNEPTSYKAVMLDPESNKWLDAMNAEMQSMIDNKVWVLVDLPPNCKTVGSKRIFKKKTDKDGINLGVVDSEVMKGLSECKASESNIKRIRVKDIIKEVKDYLNTYSSAEMDIS